MMLKVVICDDNIEDLISIEKMLVRFQTVHQQEQCEIEKFSDSNALYKKIISGFKADIYILDMLMPLKNGIDIGKLIRKQDKDSAVIYSTASDDFALEAYRVHAVRYLMKPLDEEKFYEALEYAYAFVNMKEEPLYLLKTPDGLVTIAHSRIVYVENKARVLHVHLADGRVIKSLFIRKSFENEISSLAESTSFLHVHKSFLINLKHVEKLTQYHMVMAGGEQVPVSKKKYTEVKRRYLSFVADRFR